MNLNNLETKDPLALIAYLKEENTFLKEQLDWLKRQLFGVRSEKLKPLNEDQLEFEGFDLLDKEKPEAKTVKQYERKPPNRNGQDKITLPDDIPIKTTILDIAESEKICPDTGKALVKIGEEKSYKLAHQPGSYYHQRDHSPKICSPNTKRARDQNCRASRYHHSEMQSRRESFSRNCSAKIWRLPAPISNCTNHGKITNTDESEVTFSMDDQSRASS